jgi:hypothetical protein
MAGEIFGNEPVCIYGMEWPTRQELTEMLEKIPVWMESNQQELSQMTEEETEENADMARYQSELQASMDFYREELKAYESMLDSAPEEPMETTDFSQWNYISKRNGMSYILRFSDSETEITDGYYHPEDVACVTRKKSISLEPEDYHDLCPEELQAAEQVSCWEVSEENAGENLCSLSRAEVVDLASRFVNSLGFSDLEPGDVCPLNWGGESDSGSSEIEVTDGYVVSMVHKADGIELGGSSMDYSVYGDETKSWSQYELQNTMKLYVTDDGVIAMFCMNPFTKTAVTAKVPLLPLDSIENIMIQELTENFDRYVPEAATGTQGFTSMELVYFRVQDQEENSRKYSYVPAWRLSKSPSDSGELGSCIVINAIDGSVIDVEKEVFDAK